MKNLLIILSLCSFLSTPLLAGSVASKSLSSSRVGNIANGARTDFNPAVLGFNKVRYSAVLESLTLMDMAGNEMPLSTVSLTVKLDHFFGNLAAYELENEGNQELNESINGSVGWVIEGVSVAGYSMRIRDTSNRKDDAQGFGISWEMDGKVYFGLNHDSGPRGQKNHNIGIAYRLDKKFRLEYSTSVLTDHYMTETVNKTIEIEYQLWDFILGVSNEHINDLNEEGNFVTAYLAWEPAKSGFSIALGGVTSEVYQIKEGSYFNMGYSF